MSEEHLDNLKAVILELEPTGPNGFEGLLASALTRICGTPFRLATSGAQRGRDGDSAFDAGEIYFEAKLYSNSVPKQAISDKLMDLSANYRRQIHTWIVGSTAPIPALRVEESRNSFNDIGIGIVILDWLSNTPLPPLAAAIVMGDEPTKEFLAAQLKERIDATQLTAAMDAIDHLRGLPEFEVYSEKLRDSIGNDSAGLGIVKRENHQRFNGLFSSQSRARKLLRQPLAPGDSSFDFFRFRSDLSAKLAPAFSGSSSDNIFAVVGAEGTGKSWLVASTWQQSEPASILVFVQSGDLHDRKPITQFEEFLINRLIEQTGASFPERERVRWKRRFRSWRANPNPPNVRLTLCIDGLNQNPKFEWSRFIDSAATFLEEIGGQLVITTRKNLYASISDNLVSDITRIDVEEWSNEELDDILKGRNINPEAVERRVYQVLRNPRLLGIALDLLDLNEIEGFQQLSVGRLIFEQLRRCGLTGSTDLNTDEFRTLLSEVAKKFVDRLVSGREEDLALFDKREDLRLEQVCSGSFFRPVGDDPYRYEIDENGLQVALGIWLVDALETKHQNKGEPFAQLEAVLEPVSALDMTSEIVGIAIEVACLREPIASEVVSALIRHYVSLQNVIERRLEPIATLIKHRPDAFFDAAEKVSLFDCDVPHAGSLFTAILNARARENVLDELHNRVPIWLACYTPPKERVTDESETVTPEDEDNERNAAAYKERIQGLTKSEREYVDNNLTEIEGGNINQLHKLAYHLLTGLPLMPFVGALCAARFVDSLVPDGMYPRRDFEHLLRWNSVDWIETHEGLLAWIDSFSKERSSVGDWTVVKILTGTGDIGDAEEAHPIVDRLLEGQPRFGGWRLIENYCATDPCDPSSVKPEGFSDTATKYRSMNVSDIHATMGNTEDTLYFNMAMTGVARFQPEAGVKAIERLIRDVLSREGIARQQGTYALLPHSAVVPRDEVDQFVAYATSTYGRNEEPVDEESVFAQFALFVALPHLNGDEQLRAVYDMQTDATLVRLIEAIKPASADVVEELLISSSTDEDSRRLARLLAAVFHGTSPITDKALAVVAESLVHPETTVRTWALAIAVRDRIEQLLGKVIESDWDAQNLVSSEHFWELWYGSTALVSAASADLIKPDQALDKIAFSHYGFVASQLGSEMAKLVAQRIDVAIQNVLNLSEIGERPLIEMNDPEDRRSLPPLANLLDEPTTTRMSFERFAETPEQFKKRQQRLHESFNRFRRHLEQADADLILTSLTPAEVSAMVSSYPEFADRWCASLLEAADEKKSRIYGFAIAFSIAIAEEQSERAVKLLTTYASINPLINRVVGSAKIPSDALTLWSKASIPEIASLCTERIDRAKSDHEIATEVLAALAQRQNATIESYVDALLVKDEPIFIARALTVAGFSDESLFAEQTLAKFVDVKGFVGVAANAAREAYDRNKWSIHWYQQLQSATNESDFWRYAVLLAKIVDGRFDLWRSSGPTTTLFDAFLPTIESQLERRIGKWNSKRKKTLYGGEIPHHVFSNSAK